VLAVASGRRCSGFRPFAILFGEAVVKCRSRKLRERINVRSTLWGRLAAGGASRCWACLCVLGFCRCDGDVIVPIRFPEKLPASDDPLLNGGAGCWSWKPCFPRGLWFSGRRNFRIGFVVLVVVCGPVFLIDKRPRRNGRGVPRGDAAYDAVPVSVADRNAVNTSQALCLACDPRARASYKLLKGVHIAWPFPPSGHRIRRTVLAPVTGKSGHQLSVIPGCSRCVARRCFSALLNPGLAGLSRPLGGPGSCLKRERVGGAPALRRRCVCGGA